MEVLAKESVNETEFGFGDGVAAASPVGAKKKGNITYHTQKASTATVFDLPALGSDPIVDRVHKIENLTKADALARLGELEDKHEMTYFEMGGVLSVIFKNGWFDPYSSFDEWVENKTAMRRAKARALIQIYDAIANSGVLWEQVKHIGWTKLRAIASVLTPESASQWIELASKRTKMELKELVKEHLTAMGKKVAGVSSATHVKTFKFHDDQNDTVNAAIEKAKADSGTAVDAVALEYICLDYMGGHTIAERLQAIGPLSAAKGMKDAYPTEALVAFVKEFGVMELLEVIGKAAPHLAIDVEIIGSDGTE